MGCGGAGIKPELLSSQIVNEPWSSFWCWGPQRFRNPLSKATVLTLELGENPGEGGPWALLNGIMRVKARNEEKIGAIKGRQKREGIDGTIF